MYGIRAWLGIGMSGFDGAIGNNMSSIVCVLLLGFE